MLYGMFCDEPCNFHTRASARESAFFLRVIEGAIESIEWDRFHNRVRCWPAGNSAAPRFYARKRGASSLFADFFRDTRLVGIFPVSARA
jgi:hypothetical protein